MKNIIIRDGAHKRGYRASFYVDDVVATDILKKLQIISKQNPGELEFLDVACAFYFIKKRDLYKRSRKRNLVLARRAILYHLIRKCGYTTIAAAGFFGLDHSTAIHHVRRFNESMYAEILAA